MAPAFLEGLRRHSRISLKKSSDSSTDSSGIVTNSSSTVNSANGGATPPLLTASNSSSDLSKLPTRPTLSTSTSKRQSVAGMVGLGSLSPDSSLAGSPYAPRLTNIRDKQWVHQKSILIHGVIDKPSPEGTVTVSRKDDTFPPITYPVHESNFKALVMLMPGENVLRFDFDSPKLSNRSTSNPIHSTGITIYMAQSLSSPPLQLVILLGKDSPATFDAPPSRMEREGNGLDVAVQKFRMVGYLSQAYTAESMRRNGFKPRTFRMEEEWVTGTSNLRDRQNNTMRSEAKVHVVRCNKTVEELRDVERAQQNEKGTKKGELLGIAIDAVKDYFKPLPGQTQFCAVMLLDSHWDPEKKLILGHEAATADCVALFGSHALHSYPSCFEEVVPAFQDCTPTDLVHVANDCNESGSSWECANIGIGAHLHEIGHLFGCPHEESGIMLRDYITFGRSFISDEKYSTRTKSTAGLVLAKDECNWHRLDLLRFMSHPAFTLPGEPPRPRDDSIQLWPIGEGNVLVTARSRVSFYEVFLEGDTECHYWQEFLSKEASSDLILSESVLKKNVPDDRKKAKLQKVCIKSMAGGRIDIDDFAMLASKASELKLSNGKMAYRSGKLGLSQLEGSMPEEIVLNSMVNLRTVLTSIRVYHGNFVDGLEFFYEDSTSQLFGKRGGQPTDFNFDTPRAEYLVGFHVWSGHWIDGIRIITSKQTTPVYGLPNGSLTRLIPPRGFQIAGVTGSSGAWVDGLGILITR